MITPMKTPYLKLTLPDSSFSIPFLKRFYATWKLYFLSEEKISFARKGAGLDGYFSFGEEQALGAKGKDPKEFFHFFPNGQCPPNLKPITIDLFRNLAELLSPVCLHINRLVGSDVILGDELSASPNLVIRITSYPATAIGTETAASHLDMNLFTLLPQATCDGLEVLDGNLWTPVTCDSGQVVVLFGEMLEIRSAGIVKASVHRVRSIGTARISVNFFANPKDSYQLDQRRTAKSALMDRLEEIGISGRL